MNLIAKAKAESEEAERILTEVVDGGKLTGEKELFLRSIGNEGDKRAAELHRIAKVRRYQRAAGTQDDRDATAEALKAAIEKQNSQSSQLRFQIESAQRHLRELENAVTTETKKHDAFLVAMDHLTSHDLLSCSVRVEYDAARAEYSATRQKLSQKSNRLTRVEMLIGLNDDQAIEWLRRQRDHRVEFASCIHVTKSPSAGGYTVDATLNTDGWRSYCSELAREAVELRDEIDGLQIVMDSQDAECQRIRQHYVR